MATLTQTIQNNDAVSNIQANEAAVHNSKTLLNRLVPELKFSRYATKPAGSSLPKNAGDTIAFRRFNSIAINKTPLVEGVTPEGKNFSVAKITAQVKQYGDYIVTSDLLSTVAIDPVTTELVAALGEQAGRSIEAITGDVIFGGTNVYRSGGVATRLLTATTITSADIQACRAILKKADVKPLANGDYICLAPIKVMMDIQNLADWKTAQTYQHDGLVTGEVGKLHGVRFVEISEEFVTKYAGEGAGGADLYASLFFGKDFFGMPDVEGSAKPEVIITPAGGPGDPLKQRNAAGWKNLFAVLILNQACGVRLESK